MESKAMTLRLSAEQADELKAVADADGVSVTEAVRQAIDDHIAARAADEEFRARLAAVDRAQSAHPRPARQDLSAPWRCATWGSVTSS